MLYNVLFSVQKIWRIKIMKNASKCRNIKYTETLFPLIGDLGFAAFAAESSFWFYLLLHKLFPKKLPSTRRCFFFRIRESLTCFHPSWCLINHVPQNSFQVFGHYRKRVRVECRRCVVKCTFYGNIRSLSEAQACLALTVSGECNLLAKNIRP